MSESARFIVTIRHVLVGLDDNWMIMFEGQLMYNTGDKNGA